LFQQLFHSYQPAVNGFLHSPKLSQKTEHVAKSLTTVNMVGQTNQVPTDLMVYWKCRGQFSLHNELLLFGSRIVIPSHPWKEILTKLYQGHQGIQRCRLRLVSSVWWPGASRDIETLIQNCPQCCKMATPHKEPLMNSCLPAHPWETVAADLFELNGISLFIGH